MVHSDRGPGIKDIEKITIIKSKETENKIIGMSFEECEELFGEPYLLDENTACFDGGYYIKFDLGIIYSQGELVLTMDENQEIIYAHYNYSMDLPIWYFVL